jgi:hypothetical protein
MSMFPERIRFCSDESHQPCGFKRGHTVVAGAVLWKIDLGVTDRLWQAEESSRKAILQVGVKRTSSSWRAGSCRVATSIACSEEALPQAKQEDRSGHRETDPIFHFPLSCVDKPRADVRVSGHRGKLVRLSAVCPTATVPRWLSAHATPVASDRGALSRGGPKGPPVHPTSRRT